jgi:hypothetical protein
MIKYNSINQLWRQKENGVQHCKCTMYTSVMNTTAHTFT